MCDDMVKLKRKLGLFLLCVAIYTFCFVLLLRIDMNGVIKIADFGLTESMYASNYFRKGQSKSKNDERVPIRWMAPESIEANLYTEKTDVVSC